MTYVIDRRIVVRVRDNGGWGGRGKLEALKRRWAAGDWRRQLGRKGAEASRRRVNLSGDEHYLKVGGK